MNSSLHSQGHIFTSSWSFVLQFVPACCCILPESSSKICALAVHSFTTFQTKGSCSSLDTCFHQPICLLFHLLTFISLTLIFRKLPGDPPPLFKQVPRYFDFRFSSYSFLSLLILHFLSLPICTSCIGVAVRSCSSFYRFYFSKAFSKVLCLHL